MLIGYARCSTDTQDLTAQHDGLAALGVKANRTYVDHGLTGRNRDRPGLREALAACRCAAGTGCCWRFTAFGGREGAASCGAVIRQ